MSARFVKMCVKTVRPILRFLNVTRDFGDLFARVWVAKVFFVSGLSKLADWNTTLVLFKYVYSTPLMSPAVAAYLGTGVELVFPVLLVLGFGGRFLLFGFFIYNIICILSFHFLWTPMGTAGFDDHVLWGIILMLLMFHGMGRISLDYFIHKKYGHMIYECEQKIIQELEKE